MEEDIAYHRERASRELNLGLACASIPVARAHLKLSSLHFARVRELENNFAPRAHPPFML